MTDGSGWIQSLLLEREPEKPLHRSRPELRAETDADEVQRVGFALAVYEQEVGPQMEVAAVHCFISVADRDLMLPASLTKRLANHSPPQDVTEGHTANWIMQQLRDAARRIADKINGGIRAGGSAPAARVVQDRERCGSRRPVGNRFDAYRGMK